MVGEIQNKGKLSNSAHALCVLGTQLRSAYLYSVCVYYKKQWWHYAFQMSSSLQINTWKYLKFGPNLHNEDDVMWSWSYYKKWKTSHRLSAQKIWTNLDRWLLRYETKKNACCAHAHCECLVRFTTGYLGRVHGYQQKPSMTLYILNVIFTFKIAVKDFKCGRGKSKFVFKKKDK